MNDSIDYELNAKCGTIFAHAGHCIQIHSITRPQSKHWQSLMSGALPLFDGDCSKSRLIQTNEIHPWAP